MKNFKEFREDFKDELFTSGTADLYAYIKKLKQNPNSVLHAIAMQKEAERVEEK